MAKAGKPRAEAWFRQLSRCRHHHRHALWHTFVRVRDGREIRQYLDGLRTNTVAVTATGSWRIYRWGWQFSGSQALDEIYVPFFGA